MPPKACYEDPQPATGDTRKCCVAENSTDRDDDGSCDVTISATITEQKPGCSDYKSPNTTIHCSSCPTKLDVTVKDGPGGRQVRVRDALPLCLLACTPFRSRARPERSALPSKLRGPAKSRQPWPISACTTPIPVARSASTSTRSRSARFRH